MASACRPNQLGSLEPGVPDPGDVPSRIERGVCVHEFCRYVCYRPTLAYPDPVTSLCQNISLCNRYNVKLQEYGAYHKFNMKDQGVYSRVVCGISPARILGFKPNQWIQIQDLEEGRISSTFKEEQAKQSLAVQVAKVDEAGNVDQCEAMSRKEAVEFNVVTDGPHGCYQYGDRVYFNHGPEVQTGHNSECFRWNRLALARLLSPASPNLKATQAGDAADWSLGGLQVGTAKSFKSPVKQYGFPAKSWNMRPCKSDAQAAKIQRERLFANSTAKCDDTGNSIVSYPSTRKKL